EQANALLQQIIDACALPDEITAHAALQRRFLARALIQWANAWYGKVNVRKIDLFRSAAATLYHQALSISETLGQMRNVCLYFQVLAQVAEQRGTYAVQAQSLHAAHAIAVEQRFVHLEYWSACALGGLYQGLGNLRIATEYVERGIQIAQELGDP